MIFLIEWKLSIWHKKNHFLRQNQFFFQNSVILTDFNIFQISYVIVRRIPSSLTAYFFPGNLATGITAAVEELFFWRLGRQRISRSHFIIFVQKNYFIQFIYGQIHPWSLKSFDGILFFKKIPKNHLNFERSHWYSPLNYALKNMQRTW